MELTKEVIADRYGHCCYCHKNMIVEQLIDGRPQKRFTAEYAEQEFLLNDGSRMRVALCFNCKDKISDKDFSVVMDSVIKGWEEEVERLENWTPEKKKKYLDVYSKKEIVKKSDHIKDEDVEKELKIFKEKNKDA